MAPKPKPKPKPKPNPSKPPPGSTPPRQENEPLCEFTHPCTTSTTSGSGSSNANASGGPSGKGASGRHPRKLISHIFGRNKTSTKLFPAHVWVHYCRKHYQRARYRARAWPFTQCDLLEDSLGRMEEWGGVESWEVGLRRREVHRLASSPGGQVKGGGKGEGKGVGVRKGGRGRSSASGSVSACASGDGDGDEEDADDEEEESSDDDDPRRKKKRGKGKRRRPRIKICPVPEWLRAETGPGKSFAEIRAIVARIRADLTEQHQQAQKTKGKKEQVLFPDIEILPTFRAWVLEQASRDAENGEKTRKMSRVSRKGAVQKV